MAHDKDIPVQEIRELMDVVTEKLPGLLNQLRSALFSAEAGQEPRRR